MARPSDPVDIRPYYEVKDGKDVKWASLSGLARIVSQLEKVKVARMRLTGSNGSDEEWFVLMGEKFGEVARATMEVGVKGRISSRRRGEVPRVDKSRLSEELVQLAAIACAWLEEIDGQS